jgi:hypothetical protein
MLTQKRLRETLDYNPATGTFTFIKGKRKGRIAGTQHDDRGFLKVSIDNRRHLLHRLAWLWMTGAMPRWNIEHINGDRSDNRWCNLREGDRSQKREHRPSWREPTGIPGLWQVDDRIEAMVEIQGAVINLGSFRSVEEARSEINMVFKGAGRRSQAA